MKNCIVITMRKIICPLKNTGDLKKKIKKKSQMQVSKVLTI